jgi:hypothetical protein
LALLLTLKDLTASVLYKFSIFSKLEHVLRTLAAALRELSAAGIGPARPVIVIIGIHHACLGILAAPEGGGNLVRL